MPADSRLSASSRIVPSNSSAWVRLTDNDSLPTQPALPDGIVVPGLDILELIGGGGMGVVYKARHRELKRIVAVKVLPASRVQDPGALLRFQCEAEILARLQHPNIVQIHEYGVQNDHPYLVMEFVPGRNLADRRLQDLATPESVAQLLEKIARALAVAHDQGIVHRDLKPANILLTNDYEPKVADFGLAKVLGGDHSLTSTGTVLGTPAYIPPERLLAEEELANPAGDIYSLGVILHELLTGCLPFHSPQLAVLLVQIAESEVQPLTRLRPKIPRDLETICLKCLQKDPRRRYDTARALADDLRHFLRGEPIQARRVGPVERTWRWCRRHPALSSLATTLAIVTIGSVFALAAFYVRSETERKLAIRHLEDANRNFDFAREAVDDLLLALETRLTYTEDIPAVRKQLLQSTLTFYERFLAERPQRPDLQRGTAVALLQLGQVHAALGESGPALEAIGRARELLEVRTPGDADFYSSRLLLASASLQEGKVYLSTNRCAEATRAAAASQAICRELRQEQPADPESQAVLAAAMSLQGRALLAEQRYGDAEAILSEARGTYEELVTRAPGQSDYLGRLGDVLSHLGTVYSLTKRVGEAEKVRRQAVTLAERLTALEPNQPRWQALLAMTSMRLASSFLAQNRQSEAEPLLKRVGDLPEQLMRSHPDIVEFRVQYAVSLLNQGDRHSYTSNRPDLALESYGKAITQFRAILSQVPKEVNASRYLWQTYRQRATAHRKLDQNMEALADVEAALALPEAASAEQQLKADRAILLARVKNFSDAQQVAEVLVEEKPSNPHVLMYLAGTYARLADVKSFPDKLRTAHADQAVALLRQAIAAGYANFDWLAKTSDFVAVRSRPDFQALLQAGTGKK